MRASSGYVAETHVAREMVRNSSAGVADGPTAITAFTEASLTDLL
jgi:hypothetical protein